jgi:glycosyltransferase involved in cell wall biosynthesis
MADLSDFMKELQNINTQNPTVDIVNTSILEKPINQIVHKKTKMLLVTTHTNQVNGYSKVASHLIQQLATQSWLQIVHFGTQKMQNGDLGRITPLSVKTIDASALEKEKEKEKQAGFAFTELPNIIKSEKPDVVLIYNDLSIICNYIEHIRKSIERRTFRIWAYVDLIYQGAPQNMIDILNRDVERIFAFNASWKESLKSQGISRPVHIMPHGFDPTLFRSIPRDLARQTLGLPKEVFMFTSLNKNIPRKRLDLLIMSFVKLMIRFPLKPVFLLIVADKGERGGFPLFDIFARELKREGGTVDQFGNRLLITSKETAYKDEDINLLYNCADVGISCAEGEGFGLCTFEQMGVGVPQIVPELKGYTEYCHSDYSLIIPPKLRYYIPNSYQPVSGEASMVDPEDVSKAMERYLFNDSLRQLHGRLGKEAVSAYTWEKAAEPLLKRLRLLHEDDE